MAAGFEYVLPEAVNSRPELRRQRWTIKRDELALIASRHFLLPEVGEKGQAKLLDAKVLCIGGVPGGAYQPPDWSSTGE